MGDLTKIAGDSRQRYVELIIDPRRAQRWWTAVVVTAGSRLQAERFEEEIRRRRDEGKLPKSTRFLVSPDWQDRRMGSGGATLHSLRTLVGTDTDADGWWRSQRVLMIHSGGDSRRLPQYSLSGKLFSALPVKTPWGEASTVFDEVMALSVGWAGRMSSGLLVCSGDVVLTFDAAELKWDLPGVCGVAMPQSPEVGSQHGVYIVDASGCVYKFLQKPSVAEVKEAGGLLEDGRVAVDTGLLCFDATAATRLTELAVEVNEPSAPQVDLYQHFTMSLTRQWKPAEGEHPFLVRLAKTLCGTPFWCSLVAGEFTHIGSTALFRRLLTEETEFSRLYAVQQRLGSSGQAGVRSAGVVLDSVLENAEVGPGAAVLETNLVAGLNVARGALVHGLEGVAQVVEVPEDIVVHQVPVALPDGTRGTVIRVYHVADDAKATGEAATWLGQSLQRTTADLGLDAAVVWPGIVQEEHTLWNARLFPVSTPEEAWGCARWILGFSTDFTQARWLNLPKLSLSEIVQRVDAAEMNAARARRTRLNWEKTAVALADSGADIRPLLANASDIATLGAAAHRLDLRADDLASSSPTEAASRWFQASLFYAQAGLEREAEDRRRSAFKMVSQAIDRGAPTKVRRGGGCRWDKVEVRAPARIDLGGGWSDTPPFCLDWGGTVLNAAIEIEGTLPIRAVARRIDSPLVHVICEAGERRYDPVRERHLTPGDPFAIHGAAAELTGAIAGVELLTEVNLPMGSGLGTSSILAAALLRALNELRGVDLDDQQLSDQVMRLEQFMTTGGGWQDQAGGIFPGLKLVTSGPGLTQRLRVEHVALGSARKAEFEKLVVLYNTGIRRIAKDLLQQVVGSYLARETRTVQVLHSIKTLAIEMAYAMREGEWDHLGRLMNRHWELNQVLDPHTSNAPISALLEAARPHIRGAKLAGAGGGCVFRRSRSRFRSDADRHSGVMAITVGAKRRWLVS